MSTVLVVRYKPTVIVMTRTLILLAGLLIYKTYSY